MRKIYVTFMISMSVSGLVKSQIFSEQTTVLQNFYYSSSDAGDFDGDGFQDLVITGAIDENQDGNVDTTVTYVYRNNNGIFEEYAALTHPVHLGDVKFIDINQDGLLDLISTGLSYNDIVNYKQYRFINTGTGFQLEWETDGKIYGSIEVADFNHDGLQDYLLNGTQYLENIGFVNELDLYTNQDGGFLKTQNFVEGTQNGSFKVGDFNNDMELDLIISGYDADYEYIFKVYNNENGTLTEVQELPGISSSSIALADFNADGFLDAVAIGEDVDYVPVLTVLWNNGDGTFSQEFIDGAGLSNASGAKAIETGDLNNDGYPDFIIAGDDENYDAFTRIFIYDPDDESFSEATETGLANLGGTSNVLLFENNNDNSLDVLVSGFDWNHEDYPSLTKAYLNETTEQNQKPNPPAALNHTLEENRIVFNWSGATDDKTPVNSLKYEISIGSTSGEADLAKYIVTTPRWYLNLSSLPDTFYWSIKSVDASNVLSEASEEQVVQPLSTQDITASGIKIYPNPATEFFNIRSEEPLESVQIFGLNGQLVLSKSDSLNQIDISRLAKGVYVVKILQKTGKESVIKLIKQ